MEAYVPPFASSSACVPVSVIAPFYALVRRVEWLPTNQYFDSLNMLGSLQPYSGRVTLFLARHGRGAQSVRADAGWSAFCGGGVEIVEIDGEHDTILSSDVAGLARELALALAEARARVVADAG